MLNHELSIPCGMLLCGWLLWTHWRQTPRIHGLMAPLSVSLVLGVVAVFVLFLLDVITESRGDSWFGASRGVIAATWLIGLWAIAALAMSFGLRMTHTRSAILGLSLSLSFTIGALLPRWLEILIR